jgi:hypothetical protein
MFKKMILPDETEWLPDGIQRHYHFDNGWGASVICRKDTSSGGKEGLWEIAPLRFGLLINMDGFDMGLYDIKGCLDDSQLQDELHKIKSYGRKTRFINKLIWQKEK